MVAGIRYRLRVIVNLVVGLGVSHDGGQHKIQIPSYRKLSRRSRGLP